MDPFLLTRIGDVTIQRVLPKPDTPKKETAPDQTSTLGSPLGELDLSMKTRSSSSIDKADDKGGGESSFGGGSKQFNYSDTSDVDEEGDMSDELEEDDEQDVPLSLVTTKRKPDEVLSFNPISSSGEPVTCPTRESNMIQENKIDENKSMDDNNQLVLNQITDIGLDKESSDNDDDLPLSRLIAEADIEAVGEEESEVEDDKYDSRRDKPDDYEADDGDAEGEEEPEEPEEDDEDEPENLVKGEDQEQEEGESGGEDPDREMIVVKQEMFDEEGEDPNVKRKMVETDDEAEDSLAKKTKKESGNESDSGSESESKSQSGMDKTNAERKLLNLRKNIREVMDENQLDEATLAAQRQEMERLQRVQEQQRIIREVNRQINLNRQNTKTQTRVISLLQGGGTSLLKASPPGASTSPKSTSPNTVLVKLSSGSGPPQVVNKKQVLEILRSTKSTANTSTSSKATALANKLLNNKPHSLTPSVSIAPVKPGLTITKMGKGADDDKTVRKILGKPKQKGKDVVTISSSSSDEDDCILISEPSGGEEEEEEEDPTNSGMHTNDLYNVPDDQGRVLINVGRPENEPDVFLAPQIARIIKPHQVGGVRFLYDNVVESLERFKTSPGFGCILAHSMGLGKTLQVVSFCDVFLRYTDGKTVLCIMPINTLQNWMAEFNMWLPVDPSMSPFSIQGEVQPRTFPLFVLNDLQKTMVARAKIVTQWSKEGGVLLIGYELYRQLSLRKPRKRRCNSKRKLNPDDDIDDEKNKSLLEEMHAALVKPGPDLIICDEGHRIKNSHASVSQALKQIRSKRRVVLTGYPLQNNLLEYWCMVDFVRPNYLGTKTEFSNMFERPIQNGQCIDSTPQDIRLMRYRAHVLHSLLEGFVQRRSHSVLTNALPQKEEYVILVRMTTFQRTLYDTFMNEVVRTKAVPNPLKAFAVCCKIWNHPDVLYHFLKRRNMGSEAVDLDLEETAGAMAPVPAPGGTVVPVMPVKRGRGRSPKGTSPVKRERKVNPRKRGVAEPDSPAKSPVVAAIMPNTTSSTQHSEASPHSLTQQQQLDVKPSPPFTQQPGNGSNQFRPNFPSYQSGNNSYPPQYSGGVNQNYPNYNSQQGDFQGMQPSYPGSHNQQGFNNQNMYSGFGGSYYSSQQDPSFTGGNYWNNSFFNNDQNNSGMFPNYNDPDPNGSNFYNQDMMSSDGFNTGPRAYNNGMNMNRPSMSGMNPLQQGRLGMNNPNHGMMGMNSNMGGMNMNSMGMPMNNMNMNHNNFGMNSVGMNPMSQGNLGPHNPMGMNMGQGNISMSYQGQGMGMNQMGGMNTQSTPPNTGNMAMNLPGMNQMNPSSTSSISQSGMSSQNLSSGSIQHTMTNSQVNLMSNTSNQSSMESQQQAAIENIANNLMMSSQQSIQSSQGLLGSGDNHNNPNNPVSIQNTQQSMNSSQNLMSPQHSSQNMLGSPSGMSNNPQNLMAATQNQMSSMQGGSQNQGNAGSSQNSPHAAQNQSNTIPISQNSHMMANMTSNAQSSQSISSHNSQNMGTLDNQNMMITNQQSHHVLENQITTVNSQNVGNIPNQQGYLGNQPLTPNMPGNIQNPLHRTQQPNQNIFGQQNSLPIMSNQQGMFGGNNMPMQNLMNASQNPHINQHMPNHNISSNNMSNIDQSNTQGMLSQQPHSGNQNMMDSSQNQNLLGNPDTSMSAKQNVGNLSASQQESSTNQHNQNMYSNQNLSNPMGNLQSMINNQNMMNSQGGIQNMMQSKPQSDLRNNQDSSHQSLMGMHQNISTSTQQNVSGNQSGMIMNQQGGLNDPAIGQNMLPNQQHGGNNVSSNPFIDNQQNLFGMNPNQMNQPGFVNNQNMIGLGNQPNVMNNQTMMMGGSQNMMMNNSSGQGMYGNMTPHEIMSGSSGMMGNQMNNPSFNPNQMGCGNNMMGMYNQSGMMNYQGMMMGNQVNNFGMMNQQNMNNPSLQNQNQSYGNNMMRNPNSMMGMRNTQPINPQVGMNPSDMNQGMLNNQFNNNQNNFGAFGSGNGTPSNFNSSQNNPVSKEASGSFENNSNNRFMPTGEFHCGGNQSNSQHGNLSQGTFSNDFNNFGLNSEDSKMWDDMSNKCNSEKPGQAIKSEQEVNVNQESIVKSENQLSSHENKLDDIKSPNHSVNAKIEEDNVVSENKDADDVKKEETLKGEGAEGESKDLGADVTTPGIASAVRVREDAGIPYDWATELLKGYTPGNIEASAKMALLFCILEESMFLGDRVLVFSQSLFTLNLIEDFLQKTDLPGRQEKWSRNWNYYRLDGSTTAMEREKLINEFNSNPNIHLFLVSTRAGSLGINLVGANRVVVLDASWNPCHDTQAVCRVYRYGQKKPCFVYRLVTDNCLEKKIYDRQINKQGMADRVVDECNPDAHLSIKEVTNLCWDNEEDTDAQDYAGIKDKFIDVVMQKLLERYSKFLSKEPFQHESLLVDRKDKKLSQAEKRLAKRSYELEKQANINNTRPVYGYYPGNTSGVGRGNPMMKPMASVRPMQSELNNQLIRDASSGRPRQWIPAEVWQKQGMSAQEMTLPLDVVIPTNSPDRSSIVLKAGQKVMVLKSPKGIYMQLENGKIIAIRTAFKVGKGDKKGGAAKAGGAETGIKKMVVQPTRQRAPNSLLPLRNNSNISIIPRGGAPGPRGPNKPLMRLLGANRGGNPKQPVAAAKPYFGEGSPVTVTVTKKKVPSSNQQPSTSTAQVEICRESKQVTVTPIPPPSPKDTALAGIEEPRMLTESSHDSIVTPKASESEQMTVEGHSDKVVCSVEIKPVKAVPSSSNIQENIKASNKIKETVDNNENKALSERLDEELPVLPKSLSKDSVSKNISIEERAKMEPSLQPVVSLKNYRHLAFQSNKSVVLNESKEKSKSSKVTISPLPFKTGSSLSISPVTSKTPVATVDLPSNSSLSIQPVRLPASTSVNLVKPHSSFSVTPVSEIEKKSDDVKEPSMSITKIKEKSSTSSLTITPATAPLETSSKPDPSSSMAPSENQSTTSSTSIFPLSERPKSNLTIQPAGSSVNTTSTMGSFNSPMDFSFRPDFQQLPGTRPDFYPGFPRPPIGFPGGNFFPTRKDASGKDVPNNLPQFPPFDATSFLATNPFSAAAAGSNFTGPRPNSPFTPTPRMVQPSPQPPFDADFSRMYSAFHRPEPQQVTSTAFPTPPTQYNPYPYNPFLMHTGFPIPTTNPQSNPATSNPPSQ